MTNVVGVTFSSQEPAGSPRDCSSVAEVMLQDGRIFSILAATPSWFEKESKRLGLRFYFGPAILFVREMDPAVVRTAVEKMAALSDAWLCRYDTPRTTLSKVLSDFKAAHP